VYCDRALAVNPHYVYAISYKGKILLSLKEYEESIKWYDKAIDLDPDNQTAIYHRNKAEVEIVNMKKESVLKKLLKL